MPVHLFQCIIREVTTKLDFDWLNNYIFLIYVYYKLRSVKIKKLDSFYLKSGLYFYKWMKMPNNKNVRVWVTVWQGISCRFTPKLATLGVYGHRALVTRLLYCNFSRRKMKEFIFYYDVVCPFAYVASRIIEPLAQRNGARIRWTPVLLGKFYIF